MTNTMPRPLLALDVDGPLSPFRMPLKQARRMGFRSVSYKRDIVYPPDSTWCPYSRLDLSPTMGASLVRFARTHDVELVWASLWAANAVTIVAPAMGLPRLRYVDFFAHPSRAWKWDAVVDFAAERPLAWLDDSFSDKWQSRSASGFDRARRRLPTLLHEVDASIGLRPSDLDIVADWVNLARLAW